MILDSSAIVAILLEEPERERLDRALAQDPAPAVGAPTLAETGLVLTSRLGERGQALLAEFLRGLDMTTIAFGDAHWPVALDASRRFGRGRHPARLNFGDCLTYAIARVADEPLLCIGDDFPRTDLPLVR